MYQQIFANTSLICGESYDQEIPSIEVVETNPKEDIIRIKFTDSGSGILAYSISHYSEKRNREYNLVKTFVDDLWFNHLTEIPNLVGTQPNYHELEETQEITLKGLGSEQASYVKIQAIDGCGFLSRIFKLEMTNTQ